MTDYNHSTDYVAGMTGIPQRTIQEYISAFRKYFSDQAGQAKKGRKFLPSDVDKLFLIKRLRNERTPDDVIEKYLSDEIELPFKLAHQFSTKEVMDMAANSLEFYTAAQKILDEADEKIYDAKLMEKNARELLIQARNEMTATRNQLNNAWQEVRKFRDWQKFVMQTEPDFDMYKQDDPNEPLAQEMPREKKRGWFERG